MYQAAVLTISDKGSQGLREDKSGPAVSQFLQENGYEVVYTTIIPDEKEEIKILSDFWNGRERKNMNLI